MHIETDYKTKVKKQSSLKVQSEEPKAKGFEKMNINYQYTTYILLSIVVFLSYKLYKRTKEKSIDYTITSEIIYRLSFAFFSLLVIGITVANLVLKLLGYEQISIDDKLLSFASDNLFWFILPVTVKLVGDKLDDITKLLLAIRGIEKKKEKDKDEN